MAKILPTSLTPLLLFGKKVNHSSYKLIKSSLNSSLALPSEFFIKDFNILSPKTYIAELISGHSFFKSNQGWYASL